ncbi:Endo-1,3-beta-glucanase N-terminal fragment, family GH16 [Ectocarpus siliculosus]|uniref:Endo-1,3-beta-glucanase N-terminal, family GH16 n=1 Tax=Ectocarpus siliculosus TaxID=2880 RepID=D7FU25_ECTSI|nr:Endo-1,3-beta-glucanase N-terminal fragment, family GH16 [Ectocarpus siliculosus]
MFYGCSRASNMAARIAINPVMSARGENRTSKAWSQVRTAGTFSFRYGRMEVKAKLPKGDWCEGRSERLFCCGACNGFKLWPAIWLLPEQNAYGQWPASGEIDVMESRGNSASYASSVDGVGGVDSASSAFHWGPHYSVGT